MKRNDVTEPQTKNQTRTETAQGGSKVEKLLRTGIKAGLIGVAAHCW